MGGQTSKEFALPKKENDAVKQSPSPIIQWNSREDLLVESASSDDPDLFVALYEFTPSLDNQLSLKRGERLQVCEKNETGEWSMVKKKDQKTGWVPTTYLAPVTSLDKHSWFHGRISRSAGEYLLKSGINGSFLVRESESSLGQLSISLRFDGLVYHYRINQNEDQLYFIMADRSFTTIPELVHFHSKSACGLVCSLQYPVSRKNKPTIYEVCPNQSDKWEIDRVEIQMLGILGCGQYGDVYEGYWAPYRMKVAVKTLKEETASAEDFVKEVGIMKRMKHPNLLQLIGVCSKEPPMYIVTEFMVNGNLLDYLRSTPRDDLEPTTLLYMATQIASAMMYLESKNSIHRDLAARNCLVGENHLVKVADFGLARLVREETYTAQIGSKFPIKWTAPEGLAYSQFSTKSDVWAFGVLLYELVTHGEPPYPDVSIADVYSFLETGQRMDCPRNCPQNVYQLMRKCWQWEAEKRPTFKEIHSMLDNLTQPCDINSGSSGASQSASDPKTKSQTANALKLPKMKSINAIAKPSASSTASTVPQSKSNKPAKIENASKSRTLGAQNSTPPSVSNSSSTTSSLTSSSPPSVKNKPNLFIPSMGESSSSSSNLKSDLSKKFFINGQSSLPPSSSSSCKTPSSAPTITPCSKPFVKSQSAKTTVFMKPSGPPPQPPIKPSTPAKPTATDHSAVTTQALNTATQNALPTIASASITTKPPTSQRPQLSKQVNLSSNAGKNNPAVPEKPAKITTCKSIDGNNRPPLPPVSAKYSLT